MNAVSIHSIKTRLILLFMLFGVVPAAIVAGAFFWFRGEIEDVGRAPVADTAVAVADVIDRNLFERYGDVQAFGANAAAWAPENWRNASPGNPLIAAMNAYMTNYGIYKLMVLVDLQGTVLAVNTVDATGKALDTSAVYRINFAGASWFKNAVAGKFLEGKNGFTGTVVEQPAYNPLVAKVYGEDGYTIPFAAPVKNVAGQRIGVWVNFADFGLVEDIAMTAYKGLAARGLDKTEITILDQAGNVIVDYDPMTNGQAYKRDPNVVGKLNLVKKGVAAAVAAVDGKSGVMLSTHARKNVEQAAGYAHSSGAYAYPGLGWSVLVRIADEEVNAVVFSVEFWMYLTIGVSILSIAVLAWFIGAGFAGAISGMTEAMRTLASGNKSVAVPGLERKDEIGGMAAALQVFKDQAIEMDRLQAEAKETERKAAEEKRRTMNSLADRFESGVGEIVAGVSGASNQLQATAQGLTATAEETSRQSTAVAAASEEAATNVQTVAAAAEQLAASVSEISRQVNEAASTAKDAVADARKTDTTVQGLADAAEKIGKVVDLINDIAGQTNLLALNATIEAARAGEAGKGFAVVASEVKNLATQTAKATEEISSQIGAMQSVTQNAVSAIRNIAGTIEQISQISNAIAAAVEEQGAATKEITRNVEQAAQGAKEVTRNIDGVSQAASQTGAAAGEVLSASQELSKSSVALEEQIAQFLKSIRVA